MSDTQKPAEAATGAATAGAADTGSAGTQPSAKPAKKAASTAKPAVKNAAAKPATGGVRITSKVDGFRRAGVAHSKAPTEYRAGAFDDAALKLLRGEPNLIVEDI
ncbi:MAG: HI1506-related protein [Pseudomonadota bacterium]